MAIAHPGIPGVESANGRVTGAWDKGAIITFDIVLRKAVTNGRTVLDGPMRKEPAEVFDQRTRFDSLFTETSREHFLFSWH